MKLFRLPSLGSDMDSGTLLQWRVRPGDAVQRGQVLAVVDTAKAAIDLECWHEGVVQQLLAEPGATLPVGAPLALLREAHETAADAERAWAGLQAAETTPTTPETPTKAPMAATPTKAPMAPTAAAAMSAPAESEAPPQRPRVSPAARRRAQALGLAPERLGAAGGVVTLHEVEAAAAQAQALPPPAAGRAEAMRQVIAAAMARSKREIPHFYLAEDVPFQRAQAWLAAHNAGRPPAQRLLGAALMLAAAARALAHHPAINGFWREGAFVAGEGVHLGVAVALRGGGLVAPALRDADRLGVQALSAALHDLVQRVRAGTLRSAELGVATATASLLGDEGVRCVFGVIHPPQVALLGFGRVTPRAWAHDDGTLSAGSGLTVSLAADHRAADGHLGARLLAEIRERLQAPELLDTPP